MTYPKPHRITSVFGYNPIRLVRLVAPTAHVLKFGEVERFHMAVGHRGDCPAPPARMHIAPLAGVRGIEIHGPLAGRGIWWPDFEESEIHGGRGGRAWRASRTKRHQVAGA